MPALRLKLAGSLLAGSLAGVAAIASLGNASGPQLAPASDSTDATTQPAVESPSPCPAGTVEKADSCDRVLTVQQAEEPKDDPAPATKAPAWTQLPSTTQESATSSDDTKDAAEPADTEDAQESEDADEHDSDGQQVEQEDQQHQDESADTGEHESDD